VLPASEDQVEQMTMLLECIVDSYEKLDVLVHVYTCRSPQSTRAIGRSLQLTAEIVADVLASLARAGIVRAELNKDDCGWSFDPGSLWSSSIELLVALHDLDRAELLEVMRHVGYVSVCPEAPRPMLFFRRRMRPNPVLN
jgi:hypothetical protein